MATPTEGERVALKAGPTWRGRIVDPVVEAVRMGNGDVLDVDPGEFVRVLWDDGQLSGCRASALVLEVALEVAA